MGVVRREGDWRLEKRGDGVYEITYRKEPQSKILTPEHGSGFGDNPVLDTIPVRRVDSYAEVEGLFEERARGTSHDEMGIGRSSTAEGADLPELDLGIDAGSDEAELPDLPPGGIALVLIFTGGFLLNYRSFASGSFGFLLGAVFLIGGAVILGWAGIIFRRNGAAEAFNYLATIESGSSGDASSDDPTKTPPPPEKLKDELIFDRAEQNCEWCDDHFDHLQVHHIEPRREGGPNDPENLIVLCPNCHENADREAIPRSKLRAKVRRQIER